MEAMAKRLLLPLSHQMRSITVYLLPRLMSIKINLMQQLESRIVSGAFLQTSGSSDAFL